MGGSISQVSEAIQCDVLDSFLKEISEERIHGNFHYLDVLLGFLNPDQSKVEMTIILTQNPASMVGNIIDFLVLSLAE